MRVGILDYGAGNMHSVMSAAYRAGANPEPAVTPEAVMACDRLILPGVGAAGEAMRRLRESGLAEALNEAVRGRGRPMLGICLGMQLLAESLREDDAGAGLGWIPGEVVPLREVIGSGLRVPHMGWNGISASNQGDDFFWEVQGRREFYFAHAFTLRNVPPELVAATTDYGAALVAAVQFGTVFATQFHPEKSQVNGSRVLSAFLEWHP